jgi:hypothetical protein
VGWSFSLLKPFGVVLPFRAIWSALDGREVALQPVTQRFVFGRLKSAELGAVRIDAFWLASVIADFRLMLKLQPLPLTQDMMGASRRATYMYRAMLALRRNGRGGLL